MVQAVDLWNTFFWLWMTLFVVLAFVFLWAVAFRGYRDRHDLTEFRGSMPETQRHELREHLAEEFQRGEISEEEYHRRLIDMER